MMNYQSTYTIASKDGADNNWGFNMALTPHPIQFGVVSQHDNTLDKTVLSPLLNTQIDGATHYQKFKSMLGLAKRWRLCYMSVTIQQDGPALADQGTIAACQSAIAPKIITLTMHDAANYYYATRPLASYGADTFPDFDKIQSMPGAYYTRSKDGMYMPLKLTRTCQDWHSLATANCHTSTDYANESAQLAFTTIDKVSNTTSWPFPGLATVSGDFANGALNVQETITSDMCNDAYGQIAATNVGPTTRFTVFIRAGYELQVMPGTALTPQQKVSPQYDPVALQNYFMISRELKDAYPADYNDLGKIWGVIKDVGSGVVRNLVDAAKLFPHPVVSGIARAVGGIIDRKSAVVPGLAARLQNNTASATDQEAARNMIQGSTMTLSQRFTPRKPKRAPRPNKRAAKRRGN